MASWILFLNPDTEIVEGSLSELVRRRKGVPRGRDIRRAPDRRERSPEPSMRRFPHPARWFFEAIGSERWPVARVVARGAGSR